MQTMIVVADPLRGRGNQKERQGSSEGNADEVLIEARRVEPRLRVALTRVEKLDMLAEVHLQEIAHLAPTMRALWQTHKPDDGNPPLQPQSNATRAHR